METRFPQKQLRHVAKQHPYMRPHLGKVKEAVAQPDAVTPSTSDTTVSLYYRRYDLEDLGTKYICVVVKEGESGSFMITAYPTNKIK
jgi:hypothetical protein